MKELMRLDHLRDPDAPARFADAFGEPMAAIYLTDLADWAFAIEHINSWLTKASPAVRNDYAAFVADRFGPCGGPSLDDICWMFGAMLSRMRVLIKGEGS